MRTTVDLDEDLLEMARGLAAHRNQSLGRVISDFFRKGLQNTAPSQTVRSGVRVILREDNAAPVTLEIVNQLRDEPEGAARS